MHNQKTKWSQKEACMSTSSQNWGVVFLLLFLVESLAFQSSVRSSENFLPLESTDYRWACLSVLA